MTREKFKWQKSWKRLPNGDMQHNSGLIVSVERGDGYTDLRAQESSIVIFQAAEGSRGVPLHDQVARLQRLLKEAQQWHEENP